MLDSSVAIAALRDEEPAHEEARAFMEALRAAAREGRAIVAAPAELWLEVYVVEERLRQSKRAKHAAGSALAGLAIALWAPREAHEIEAFLAHLAKRMRGRRAKANGTDLMYLWAGYTAGAAVVTLDEGMLGYHLAVCEVMRPAHVRLG
ncbi:MAG: PIN domain-containing protein [Byssovorax sp.]